jgi:hypothetical protein
MLEGWIQVIVVISIGAIVGISAAIVIRRRMLIPINTKIWNSRKRSISSIDIKNSRAKSRKKK